LEFFLKELAGIEYEHLPEHCHRRLVVDYLDRMWGGVSVTHIV